MNKCLSLVHLTSRIGPQSSGSDESTSWFLRCPNPDLDLPGTKSVSSRLTLIAAVPCSALRLNFRAGNHLPRTPQLRLPTSQFERSLSGRRFRVCDVSSRGVGIRLGHKEITMTRLRKMMLEELERRNYAQTTIDCYIQT